jgi:subtilisin family serine protease
MTTSQTCKNCLVVGATQLSDSLFRGMKPLIDQGYHCRYSAATGCCVDPLTCVQTTETSSPCCQFITATKMSLPCCPTAYTCSTCSVQSGNIRDPYNVATFSSRGTAFDDGRIKPDMVAPGEDILSAAAPARDSDGVIPPTNKNYCGIPSPTVSRTLSQVRNMALSLKSGTSMATPLAAGAVEKIRQYFKQGYYPSGSASSGSALNPDESLLRAVILASAKPLSGSGGVWTATAPFSSGFSRFPIPNSANIPGHYIS